MDPIRSLVAYSLSTSHSQPGQKLCIVGAILCAIPVVMSFWVATMATNPEVCYVWSLVFWAGMFAFILRWAIFPRRVQADSTGLSLVSLLGKTLIPYSDIEQLSVVTRLRKAVTPWDTIEMTQYSALSIQRRGRTERSVAMKTDDARAIESIYLGHAPPENLARQARLQASWDPEPELVLLQKDVERFVLDLRRNLILKDIAAAMIFCLTAMVTIKALPDINLRNEIVTLETKAFLGVLIGAIIMACFFIMFPRAYKMYINNRAYVIFWRIERLNVRLQATGRALLEYDRRINDLLDKSYARLQRMTLVGVLMCGVTFTGIGVFGYAQNQAGYTVNILVYGIGFLLAGAFLYFYYRSKDDRK